LALVLLPQLQCQLLLKLGIDGIAVIGMGITITMILNLRRKPPVVTLRS
jgi:hypothetical protein